MRPWGTHLDAAIPLTLALRLVRRVEHKGRGASASATSCAATVLPRTRTNGHCIPRRRKLRIRRASPATTTPAKLRHVGIDEQVHGRRSWLRVRVQVVDAEFKIFARAVKHDLEWRWRLRTGTELVEMKVDWRIRARTLGLGRRPGTHALGLGRQLVVLRLQCLFDLSGLGMLGGAAADVAGVADEKHEASGDDGESEDRGWDLPDGEAGLLGGGNDGSRSGSWRGGRSGRQRRRVRRSTRGWW